MKTPLPFSSYTILDMSVSLFVTKIMSCAKAVAAMNISESLPGYPSHPTVLFTVCVNVCHDLVSAAVILPLTGKYGSETLANSPCATNIRTLIVF
jgi:hypothetical protein